MFQNPLAQTRHSLAGLMRPTWQLLWLEVWRTRLLVLCASLLLLITGAGLFVQSFSLGDEGQAPVLICAGLLRLACSFMVGVFVVTSMQRRIQERQVAQQLTLALTRANWLLVLFLIYGVLAILFAALYALPLALWQLSGSSLAWAGTLLLEVLLVSALAVTVALTFSSQTTALSFLVLAYIFARIVGGLILISGHPIIPSAYDTYWGLLIQGLGWLVPRLDWFANSAWLTGQPFDVWPAVWQTVLYWPLLYVVARHDLQRKEW